MTERPEKPSCFIAMPISVHENEATLYRDKAHWDHVMRHLFVPAVERAGFVAILPFAAGTSMIHGRIVKHLTEADLVLCDLSQHNPNVLFELGVRTSIDKPVALVKDEHLKLPFDIQGLNTHEYAADLAPWTLESQIADLVAHIEDTVAASNNKNPLWQHFGVSIAAAQPPSTVDPRDATMQLLLERMEGIERAIRPKSGSPIPTKGNVIMKLLGDIPGVKSVSVGDSKDGPIDIRVRTQISKGEAQQERIDEIVERLTTKRFTPTVVAADPERISLALVESVDELGRSSLSNGEATWRQ